MSFEARIRIPTSLTAALLLAIGCASSPSPDSRTSEACEPPSPMQCTESEERVAELEDRLEELRRSLAEREASHQELATELDQKAKELARTEERFRSIEAEWRNAVEVMLRPESGPRRIDSRPLAVSRISEVRVQLQELEGSEDGEVLDRVDRARELLSSADEALANDNPAGAGFFAERAAELLRQATRVVEFRSVDGNEPLLPLLPPRDLRVIVEHANLRAGPNTSHQKLATIEAGTELLADARSGDWFRVTTAEGISGWILRRLTE